MKYSQQHTHTPMSGEEGIGRRESVKNQPNQLNFTHSKPPTDQQRV